MNQQDMDELLRSMLDDHRLSRAERRSLRKHASEQGLSNDDLALFRSRAFDMAKSQVGADALSVVDWLENAVKALLPFSESTQVPASEARFSPGLECLQLIVGEFRRAVRTADVCVFTVTDNRIVDAILDAHRRGIQIRIVTDDDKSLDRGSDIARLASAGVAVRMDTTPAHMHHKFAVFDKATLVTGSYNWTRSAADENQENLVRSTDVTLVEAFAKTFERLWRAFSDAS